MKSRRVVTRKAGIFLGALVLSFLMAPTVFAINLPDGFLPFFSHWTVHGFAREYLSYQLKNLPETKQNDFGDVSMNRQSLYLDTEWLTGSVHWTARVRGDFENLSALQIRLQNLTAVDTPPPGGRADFRNEYDRIDLREFFFDWQATDNLHFRVGRQQVAWGQTDFFHATDVIEGYDFSWRKFLPAETEQIRKPLILFNMTYNVPQANGGLQVIVRPGLGQDNWVGNTEPTFGGLWSNDGQHGFNFISRNNSGLAVYNYHYHGSNGVNADVSGPDYGLRWTGTFSAFGDGLTYALNYYHGHGGFYQDGTVIVDPAHPFHGRVVQMVYPTTDTVGGSISGPINSIDSVYRVEVAYTPDRHMSSDLNGDAPFTSKDAYNFVLGLDTNLYLQKFLHTSNSSLLSMQMFDWYIPDATEADKILRFDGSGYFAKNNYIATVVFSNPFFFDNLHLIMVGLADLTEGGGMVIPTVEYRYGPHWRLHLEGDIAMGGGYSARNPPAGPKVGSVFGSLRDEHELFIRIGYQF